MITPRETAILVWWGFIQLMLALFGVAMLFLVAGASYRYANPPLTANMALTAIQGITIQQDYVPLKRISPHLQRAVIAAEDTRFCSHGGIDWDAVREALRERREGRGMRGASTITQQTSKNLFFWNGGGWPRKAGDAVMALWIDTIWPKSRVLEHYLNIAEWGDGLYGAEAAAQARFGVSASELSPRQAALLAAVLPNPKSWRVDPPGPYVTRRASQIEARMRVVARDGLAACLDD